MNTTDLINLLRDQLIVTPGMSARQLGKYLHNDPFLIAKVLHENKDLFSQQADGFGWSALKDAKTEKSPAATKVDELRKSQDQQVCDVDEERDLPSQKDNTISGQRMNNPKDMSRMTT